MNRSTDALLGRMTDGESLSTREQVAMVARLSVPAILAQISVIVMQYIDAAMVGRLGSADSASIGLVSSTTWLMNGLCMAAGMGFTVRIAHAVGASISAFLPRWLGGEEVIRPGATAYFLVFALSLPFVQLNSTVAGMLQCSGNMKLPGLMEVVMCVLDVILNFLLIFPTRAVSLFGAEFTVWGAGLGVTGAALGTALSEVIVSGFLLWYLLCRSEKLRLRKGEPMTFTRGDLRATLKIAAPAAMEQFITCSAYIAFTRIVSPLGTIAIAAHSFSITAESLCYMPGYGIGSAATTVVGQSLGARRYDLTKRLARLSVWMGVIFMSLGGVLLYIFAPSIIGLLSPDPAVQELGAAVLRIEAFAEPMYAASIVATGAFRGAGDTVVPSVLNFVSMWIVRIPLACALSLSFGLSGVWTAMCIELCVRGILFIILLMTRFRRRADRGLYVRNASDA